MADKAQDSAGQRFIIDIKLQTRPTTGNDPTYDVIWNSWSNPFKCKHAARNRSSHSSISITVDLYGHWVPGEGRAGLEAALAVGAGKGADEGKIVPFSVPNLQISANEA